MLSLKERGTILGIITNGRAVKQWDKILRMSLEHFFDVVAISELVGYEKPDPRIFKHALKEINIKAREGMMVDDKPKGLIGAKKLEMKTVLMNAVSGKKNDFDFVVNSLSKILEVIS